MKGWNGQAYVHQGQVGKSCNVLGLRANSLVGGKAQAYTDKWKVRDCYAHPAKYRNRQKAPMQVLSYRACLHQCFFDKCSNIQVTKGSFIAIVKSQSKSSPMTVPQKLQHTGLERRPMKAQRAESFFLSGQFYNPCSVKDSKAGSHAMEKLRAPTEPRAWACLYQNRVLFRFPENSYQSIPRVNKRSIESHPAKGKVRSTNLWSKN